MGSNFIVSYLINFEKNDTIELKLLSILEKMLSTLKKDWCAGLLNQKSSNYNILIIYYLAIASISPSLALVNQTSAPNKDSANLFKTMTSLVRTDNKKHSKKESYINNFNELE